MWIRQFENLGRNFRHFQRSRDIVWLLLKYGYEELAHKLHLPSALNIPLKQIREAQKEILNLTPPQKLRRLCEEVGPSFIKLGQILSTRPNLLPPAYVEELKKLQDSVQTIPFPKILEIIERELECPVGAIFEEIDEKPLGAASIGQVHEARLLTGERVVLKVQRPGIRKTIEVDLEIMCQLAALIEEHVESWAVHQPGKLVNDLARKLEKEIDFSMEAAHIERFTDQFASEENLYIPKVYRIATTRQLLTMEHVGGTKAASITETSQVPFDREQVAKSVTDLMMKQIFVHGFFHADPHPGNIHILADGRVCFLDFGMMGFIDQRTRETLADLVWGIARRNESSVVNAVLRLGSRDQEPVRHRLEADISDFIHQHFYQSMGQLEFGKLVGQLLGIIARHGIQIPQDFFLMLKALGLTEDFVKRMAPDLSLIEEAGPFLRDVRLSRMSPLRLAESLLEFGVDFADLAREMPGELRRILAQVKTGETRIIFKHEGLDPVRNSWDQISNRISFSIVLAALIIGSSIMVYADIPPKWNDIPVIGLAGFVMAALMAFRLLISIIKHGRM